MYDLPINIVLDLFDKMILPILLYGSEIWGYENIDNIEIFYRKFLKNTLRLNKQTTSCMVYGEAGRKPLSITIKSRMICFWHKITTGPNNKLSYKLTSLLKELHKPVGPNQQPLHSSPWLNNIEQILNNCGMRHVWLNPDLVDHNWLKKALEQRLSDIYIQEWQSQVDTMSSCITYRSIKPYFKQEKYLMLPNIADRINICRFRCRNTKIPVVTQGYTNRNNPTIAYEDRICDLCDKNELGDEYHYILECPVFQTPRNRYISDFYKRNPSMEKFTLLLQSNSIAVLSKLAKLIHEINRTFR